MLPLSVNNEKKSKINFLEYYLFSFWYWLRAYKSEERHPTWCDFWFLISVLPHNCLLNILLNQFDQSIQNGNSLMFHTFTSEHYKESFICQLIGVVLCTGEIQLISKDLPKLRHQRWSNELLFHFLICGISPWLLIFYHE